HQAGARTVAALRFGAGETAEDRVEFLEAVRVLQERTGGFAAFALARAGGGLARGGLARGGLEGPTAVESLKMLAVSRLMLDPVANVEAGWTASGLKVLEMGLRFGANDAGQVVLWESPGERSSYEEDLRRVIRDAGLLPVERDGGYRMQFLG
ncbi:MAG: dehypoxanthine futalosine cyclase, partial [Acidobacteriota bacterium]|nr:dehypoxanthine futalosine cyclase [Acidobacteriota bacterium]